MNEKNVLDLFGGIRDKYVAEAVRSREQSRTIPLSRKRLLMTAALIALMLLLVGCAAVFLWLQDRSIGQETYTQRFDAEGHYIEPTEKTMDTVTLFGSGGSNMQKALAEWLEFKQNYPDFSELNLTDEDAEKIPERYHYTYDCYTFEMVDALEEIAEKYNLKLLDTEIPIQRYQYETAMEGLGLTSLLCPDAGITMENGQGGIRLPHNLSFEFFVNLKDSDVPWAKDILVNYHYAHAEYFPGFGATVLDLEEVEQWKYTTKDGTSLLLALDRKGRGIVLAEREDAMIYLDVNSNFWGPNFPDPEDVMDREGLELLADAFDYSITPQPVDLESLQSKLDADQKASEERMQEAVITYAGFTEFLLENAHSIPTWHYALCDLDGDGAEEMIIGSQGANFTWVLHNNQGKVREHTWVCDVSILENGGLMMRDTRTYSAEQIDQISYTFYEPLPNGAALTFDSSGQGPAVKHGELAVGLICENGAWRKYHSMQRGRTPISEAETQSIIDQYPEKELDWQPVWDYPIDASGRTIGDELSSRKLPQTEAEYIQFYAGAAESGHVWLWGSHTHFALRDMNSDGILDILLSSDGTSADFVFTWKYGRAVSMGSYFSYLCEDNVMCLEEISSAEDGADLHHYSFTRFNGTVKETLADIVQNKASGVWTDPLAGTTISAEEAKAVLTKYPRIEIDFRPIDELTG